MNAITTQLRTKTNIYFPLHSDLDNDATAELLNLMTANDVIVRVAEDGLSISGLDNYPALRDKITFLVQFMNKAIDIQKQTGV